MKLRWSRLGGQLGIAFCLAGLVLVFLGWNGAATYDRVSAQFPYLISGGLAGLSLVVIGAALLVTQTQRADRASLQGTISELRSALERMGGEPTAAVAPTASATTVSAAPSRSGLVAIGESTYHRQDCKVLEGRSGVLTATPQEAGRLGLTPCRVCDPGALAAG